MRDSRGRIAFQINIRKAIASTILGKKPSKHGWFITLLYQHYSRCRSSEAKTIL
jgi:hypothetical protein